MRIRMSNLVINGQNNSQNKIDQSQSQVKNKMMIKVLSKVGIIGCNKHEAKEKYGDEGDDLAG
jgi:hypothetical protein